MKRVMRIKEEILQHPTNPRITFKVKRSACRHYFVTAMKDGEQLRPYKRVGLAHLQAKGYLPMGY